MKEKIILWFYKIKLPAWINQILYKLYLLERNIEGLVKFKDFYFFRCAAIEISTYCNRKCAYCPNSVFESPKKLMDFIIFKKAILRLKEIGFSGSLYFHFYNEPMLDTRLEKLVVYAKKELPNAMIRIFTNGDYLNIENMEALIKAGVMQFAISNHTSNRKMFDKRMAIMLKKFGKNMEIRYPQEGELSNRGGLVKIEKQDKRKTCTEPLRTLQIDYLGNVILCCDDYFRKHKFGNIRKEKLVDIWNKKEFKKVRQELRLGITSYDICRKCLCK